MNSRPPSSEKERPVFNREVPGSSPGEGSNFWHYVVVRRELTGGALLAQVLHASADSLKMHLELGGSYPQDARGVVLVATKEQLADLGSALVGLGQHFHVVTETDGPLAGSTTALALITSNRDALKPALSHLRPWRAT